ncbi:MAG: bis(5'-nucleosyl)-tetraphosphatase (symmetrical) YqeK [Fervidobacterium sp.]|nr:bis(5'-nucleosyl)-tetraphosphatase (symmetrical) YqeK [Fervidobacterium sp.]
MKVPDYELVSKQLEILVKLLVNSERFEHIYGVVDFCERLAKRYSMDMDKLKVMALAHDLFRDIDGSKLKKMAKCYGINLTTLLDKKPILLHGLVSAEYLRKRFGVQDTDILLGVAYHTSGHPEFGIYSKALVLADSLEFTRLYDKVNQLRELAFFDIDLAFKEVIKNKITYALSFNLYVLPDTLETWNKLVEEEEK